MMKNFSKVTPNKVVFKATLNRDGVPTLRHNDDKAVREYTKVLGIELECIQGNEKETSWFFKEELTEEQVLQLEKLFTDPSEYAKVLLNVEHSLVSPQDR